MSDMGGPESLTPSEGEGGAPEELSEEARQRFAAAGAALQALAREEKKAKHRDQGVAQAILQFLNDEQRAHLSTLIAELCARNCPSPFLLALLSLVSEACLEIIREYLREAEQKAMESTVHAETALTKNENLDRETNALLIAWITRIQLVLSLDPSPILHALRTEESPLDPTLLQLTTFIMQEFLEKRGKAIPYERAHPFAAGILQMTFEPFLTREENAAHTQSP